MHSVALQLGGWGDDTETYSAMFSPAGPEEPFSTSAPTLTAEQSLEELPVGTGRACKHATACRLRKAKIFLQPLADMPGPHQVRLCGGAGRGG